MKLSTAFVSALFVGTSLAVPSRLEERVAARTNSRQSQPMQKIVDEAAATEFRKLGNGVQYSNNWAGAVWENPPPEGPFSAVGGTFTVPEPKIAGKPSGDGTTAGSAWVGIDGDTYGAAILQAGVDFYINQDGSTSFDAWYEWYPDYAYDFEMSIAAGDVITIWIQSYNPSEGVIYIENETTGETASQQLKAPDEKSHLAGKNAEWIVEDFQSGGKLVNLVDFGTVTFTDAKAQAGKSDAPIPVKGATIIELKQGDKVLTKSTVKGPNELEVTYVG